MSVFHNNALIGAGAGTGEVAAAEYVIPKSLRFNSGDSAYLSKTFSTEGNRRTWTWSAWIKLGKVSNWGSLFKSGASNSNPTTQLYLYSDGTLEYITYDYQTTGKLTTSQVFRDPSAWYHIVLALDTTNATADNRQRLYINGVEVTQFANRTNHGQNYETRINSTNPHEIGRTTNIGGSSEKFFDGQMADIQFVDGQQLAPTAFGETRSSDGVWVPKEYTGFGTNPNNGTTWSDSLTTNAGDNFDSSGAKTLAFDGSPTTNAFTANNSDGLTQNTSYIQLNSPVALTGTLQVVCDNGNAVYDVTGGGSTLLGTNNAGSDDVLVDCGTITNATNIRVLMTGGSRPSIGQILVGGHALIDGARDNSFHLNFSDSSTNEALGFDSAPTISDPDPKKGFDVVTYTGNGASTPGGSGSTQNVGGLAFEPGLLWIKDRTQSGHNHNLIDVINQPPNLLMSDSTAALTTNSTDGVTSFNPDGFTLGANSSGSQSLEMNKSGNNYVAWAWKANGPAVSNSDGTITTEVSANTDYGFSVIKFVGVNNATPSTIGHGLGAVPKWVIVKNLTDAEDWAVYHASVGNTKYLQLNTTAAAATSSQYWNDTSPTTALITLNNHEDVQRINRNYVVYAWSEVSGYSKFSSYSGTGSTHTVDCGFRPAFLIVKSSTGAYNWQIKDKERGDVVLFADTNSADTSDGVFDLTDNGFTVTGSGNATNASGQTYIFAAFADRPGNNWDVNNIVTNEGLSTSKSQFDVVTYTGNGGFQQVGGPVYSATSTVSSPTNVFNGDTSNGGVFNNAEDRVLTAGSITITSSLEIYHNRPGSDGITVNINGTDYVATGLSSTGYHTIPIPGSDLPLTSTGNITIKDNVSGAQSTVYAVRVDGNVLRDNTGHALKFQPDLVWLKGRSYSISHLLYDSVRGFGADKELVPNGTNAEGAAGADSTYGYVSAVSSTGFTVQGGSSANDGYTNKSGATYVAWCWKAGGTAVSNTDGSITSSVSANAAYGFSIVSYTGSGSAATVGHGLSTTPGLVICKDRSASDAWLVWAKGFTSNEYLYLNTNAAKGSYSGTWGSTPTNSVFGVSDQAANQSGNNFVAYCFADVSGYQRIGSYTGNGSSTGPVVVTGFKPRFLLIKGDNTSGWVMYDSERDLVNPNNFRLQANSAGAESTGDANTNIDFLDNGFQLKNSDSDSNGSGVTYVYLAIGDDEIGSDEDCLVDVPNAVTADADATDTTGGYQRGNYSTWNPLFKAVGLSSNGTVTLTDGNLEAAGGNNSWTAVAGTIAATSGKWYAEFEVGSLSASNHVHVGINPPYSYFSGVTYHSTSQSGHFYGTDGQIWSTGSPTTGYTTSTTGDIIGVALDFTASTVTFYKNGVYIDSVSLNSNITSNGAVFAADLYPTGTVKANFGQMRFKYPMPSGHAALNTTALPAATIADGSAQFDAVTYTSDNQSSKKLTFEFGLDLFWSKVRNFTEHHVLHDSVRGPSKVLKSSSNAAESTESSGRGVLSFDSDGATIGIGSPYNSSGNNSVVWGWNAGANSNKTYTVKVVSDSGNKYRFDDFGTSAVTLDLAEGSTYIFDQSDSSNAGHPIRFGTSANGTDYTTGVTHTGTPGSAGAKTTLVLGTGVSTLYYSCQNHSGMGGQINTNSTAGASNFDGSIQTTVKANPEAGFSIVSYTGDGSTTTWGHGLSVAPKLIFFKRRNNPNNWFVLADAGVHSGFTIFEGLNNTNAAGDYSSNASASNTIVTLPNTTDWNTNGGTYIAYCFTPVAGYSAFGSYTGNGSNDGPFVYTGFRPRWLMIKRTDSTSNWVIVDAARSSFNEVNDLLYAEQNLSETVDDGNNGIDFLSNGFKLRKGVGGTNVNGATLVYIAFASNPFQANGGLAR